MIRELFVQNLALIEDVRVELQPGFCAWTGETGAGKSLLLGALGLLLGERGSSDLIRTGAEELRVTGRFELDGSALKTEVERVLSSGLEENELIHYFVSPAIPRTITPTISSTTKRQSTGARASPPVVATRSPKDCANRKAPTMQVKRQ